MTHALGLRRSTACFASFDGALGFLTNLLARVHAGGGLTVAPTRLARGLGGNAPNLIVSGGRGLATTSAVALPCTIAAKTPAAPPDCLTPIRRYERAVARVPSSPKIAGLIRVLAKHLAGAALRDYC